MAFKIYSTDDNRVPGIEYLPASAITPKVGMALTQTTGQLALATGAPAPTYISMCEKDGECTAGDIIPGIRVCSCRNQHQAGRQGDAAHGRPAGHGHDHQRRGGGGVHGRHRQRQHVPRALLRTTKGVQ